MVVFLNGHFLFFSFLSSICFLFFSFSFSLVFSPLHRHIHISPFSPFIISTFHLILEPPSLFLLFFCAYLFVFIFFPLRLTSHTQSTMISWLLLYVCIFVFYFLSSSSHFTHTQLAERLAFIYLFFFFFASFLVLIHFVVTMELR